MKKNNGNIEDNAKLKKFEKLRNFKDEEQLNLKIFNFGWWRNPPYKNDDFRHRVQLS